MPSKDISLKKIKGYGVYLRFSLNNVIHHNNFINNAPQAGVDTFHNTWDDGREGNYWSDYNGTDSNHDGAGDAPYVLNKENIDHHPLMKPIQHHSMHSHANPPVNPHSNP